MLERPTVSSKSDIYSLGCLIYALCKNGPPIAGSNASEAISAAYPIRLREVVTNCLQEAPKDRPRGRDVINELGDALADMMSSHLYKTLQQNIRKHNIPGVEDNRGSSMGIEYTGYLPNVNKGEQGTSAVTSYLDWATVVSDPVTVVDEEPLVTSNDREDAEADAPSHSTTLSKAGIQKNGRKLVGFPVTDAHHRISEGSDPGTPDQDVESQSKDGQGNAETPDPSAIIYDADRTLRNTGTPTDFRAPFYRDRNSETTVTAIQDIESRFQNLQTSSETPGHNTTSRSEAAQRNQRTLNRSVDYPTPYSLDSEFEDAGPFMRGLTSHLTDFPGRENTKWGPIPRIIDEPHYLTGKKKLNYFNFSPSGEALAFISSDGTVLVYSFADQSCTVLGRVGDQFNNVGFFDDDKLVVCSTRGGKLMAFRNAPCYFGESLLVQNSGYTLEEVFTQGVTLFMSYRHKHKQVRKIRHNQFYHEALGECLEWPLVDSEFPPTLECVAWSPCRRYLVTGFQDADDRVGFSMWELNEATNSTPKCGRLVTFALTRTGYDSDCSVNRIEVCHGGSAVAIGFETQTRSYTAFWDQGMLGHLKVIRCCTNIFNMPITTQSFALSSDGSLLAIGGGNQAHNDGQDLLMASSIQIWSTYTMTKIQEHWTEGVAIQQLAFSPCGEVLISLGRHGTMLRIWDVKGLNRVVSRPRPFPLTHQTIQVAVAGRGPQYSRDPTCWV